MLFSVLFSGQFNITTIISALVSSFLVVFVCWPVREAARAFVAYKLGDPTPKYNGSLTLNPLAHIDIIGSIAMVLFGFGWGKGSSINPYYLKNPKRDIIFISLAGPVSNIALGFVFYFLAKIFYLLPVTEFSLFLQTAANYVVLVNISLAAFHLIPIPPLDASNILPIFMSDATYNKFLSLRRFFPYILMALIVTNVLDYPLYFIQRLILALYNLLTFWI